MRTLFWPTQEGHDPAILAPPPGSGRHYYADVAARATILLEAMRRAGLGEVLPAPDLDVRTDLALVHHPGLLAFLSNAFERWQDASGQPAAHLPAAAVPETFAVGLDRLRSPSVEAELGWYCLDTSSPLFAGTHSVALGAATCAAAAAEELLDGAQGAYALCRPPGHHAMAGHYGGFCYFNNTAVAARRLSVRARRVAVLDIDAHHGNGTQDVFWDDPDVFVASLHMDPSVEYPYHWGFEEEVGGPDAEGTNLNVVLPIGCSEARYLGGLEVALTQIAHFEPDALVVALGVDTHRDDPLGRFELDTASFLEVGDRIADLGVPTVFVQEGGYDLVSLGECVTNTLRAVAAR